MQEGPSTRVLGPFLCAKRLLLRDPESRAPPPPCQVEQTSAKIPYPKEERGTIDESAPPSASAIRARSLT